MDDMPEQDRLAVEALERYRGAAKALVASRDLRNLRVLANEIVPVLDAHTIFGHTPDRYLGTKYQSLTPFSQSVNALVFAANHSSVEALRWLHKIYATEH